MLINKEPSKFIKRISDVSIKTKIKIIICLGIVLSIVKIFEYEFNNGDEFYLSYNYPLFFNKNYYSNKLKRKIISYVLLIRCLINFLVFFLLNSFLEFLILIKLSKELRKKRERQAKMAISSIENERKNMQALKKDSNRKKKFILIIIINGLINIIFRFPELFDFIQSSSVLFHSKLLFKIFCKIDIICYFLVNISNLFFIITLSTNFLIFLIFNNTFRDSSKKYFKSKIQFKKKN